MQPRLLAISGSLTGATIPLHEGRLSIGRDAENGLCLIETVISRMHCKIDLLDGNFELVDLGSRNGTFVGGIPVRRREIQHGETIRIGASEFVFLTHEGEGVNDSKLIAHESSTTLDLKTVRISSSVPHLGFGVEVGRMARDLSALFKISNAINSIRQLEPLQHSLLRLILEVIPADEAAVILLPDGDRSTGSVAACNRQGDSPALIEIRQEVVDRARWENAAVVMEASSGSDPGSGPAQKLNALCMPLTAVEKTIGVLYMTAKGAPSPFREDHIHFLGMVSRVAAVTLENVIALNALQTENRRLQEELSPNKTIVGESAQVRRMEEFIARVAKADVTVLIRGESGTGKEVVARAIHQQSPRGERPFVAINCAAIPETLIETELFGHEKGAFTGAAGQRKGKFEAAADGTLFLDELGELPLPMQAKLLRVLQQREFERVGGTQTIAFKARVLAATNRNLEEAIQAGEFRQDLYYRLNVISLTVPPLREHREDIPLLALYFAAKYAQRSNRPFKGISRAARTLLLEYSWPGNVRELENAIEHAIVLGLTDEIKPEDLPDSLLEERPTGSSGARYHDTLTETKKGLIRVAMVEANGSVPAAAQLLGIHPKYLHRLMRSLDLRAETR